MEVCMSLKVPSPSIHSNNLRANDDVSHLIRHSFSSSSSRIHPIQHRNQRSRLMIVEAKGKRGMQDRQFRRPMPALPKIEDDGNPRFVIFIRMANVYLWYPVSIVAGGTTAKILVAGKDNFVGKYIYKDTLSKNLAGVIYKDEKEVQKTAIRQHRVLRSATEFRYGYKLVEGTNIRAALASSDVIELPTKAELKTVLDKVVDFFGDARESFGKLTDLKSTSEPEPESEESASDKTNESGNLFQVDVNGSKPLGNSQLKWCNN
ncbi:hypothetical protein SSX86_020903 [Deinandra increscens subsp. villosa]|uniref:Protein HHL1, chloroplastic n=1 Tax=Deinandra increscens subsp. villosa TaxID=3103831 RepID=A0AAP0CNV6_9ASTR